MLVLATLPSDDNRLRLTVVLRLLLLVVMMLMLMVVTEISGGGDGGCLPGWCRHLLSIDNTGPL